MNCPKCNHHNEEGSKFCGDCGGDLAALVSEYDQPEAIVQYREVLIDFLGDLELEDYEEEELELVRGELKVTLATHEALVEEMGGTADSPIPIAILLDTFQIAKFHVGGSCVFSFQFENQSDRAVRSVSLTFRDSELTEPMDAKTKPIGPGRVTEAQVVATLTQSGAHELSGEVTVVKTSGDPEQFELEPITYDVGRDSDTPTNITMDLSSLRVADLGNAQIGGPNSTQSGVVSDRTWLPLKLIRVSTAIRAEEEKRRQEVEEVRQAEEHKKCEESAGPDPTSQHETPEPVEQESSHSNKKIYCPGCGLEQESSHSNKSNYCPSCGMEQESSHSNTEINCPSCGRQFDRGVGYVGSMWCPFCDEGKVEAAGLGNLLAQCELGDAYYGIGESIDGIAQDYGEALKWYLKAAEQGDNSEAWEFAQDDPSRVFGNIGTIYHNGAGVAQDYDEARRWYLKAIELGSEEAQTNLDLLVSVLPMNHIPALDESEMGSLETDIGARVLKVLNDSYVKDLYVIDEGIPKKKLKNALENFGTVGNVSICDEAVLGLINCTVMGSAKNGILFGGTTGIFYKNSFEQASLLTYAELLALSIDGIRNRNLKPGSDVTVGDHKFDLAGSTCTGEDFRDLIIEIKQSL